MISYSITARVPAPPVGSGNAQVDFDVPAMKRMTLVYMGMRCVVEEAGPPVVNRDVAGYCSLRAFSGASIPLGQVMDAAAIPPTVLQLNFGWPFCSDKVAFTGCWEIPLNLRQLSLIMRPAYLVGYVILAASIVEYDVELQFEVE